MIQIRNLSFSYHDESTLFHELTCSLSRDRYGLVGPNASGKSTLLALLAGRLRPTAGSIFYESQAIHDLPQLESVSTSESFDLRVLRAGNAIQAERASGDDWLFMEDHWPLFAAMQQSLQQWGLLQLDLSASIPLSGGTEQRLRLALALAHEDSFLLLDEPSNHLDREGRLLLIKALQKHRGGCLVASHDRELLNSMDRILALEGQGLQLYGGGYDSYKAAADQQQAARQASWEQTRQELDRVRGTAQRVREKQEKKSAQGQRQREKGGIPRIALGLMRMQAEQTSGQLQTRHEEKITELRSELREKAEKLLQLPDLHLDVRARRRPGDRPILSLENLQHRFTDKALWPEALHVQLGAGEQLAILGANGSGKSTLLQIILGRLEPSEGRIHRRFQEAFMLDQDLAMLPAHKTLLELWDEPVYRPDPGLRRTIAARLGLKAREAATPFDQLSGGQRLRAALVLLATRLVPPDLILLDEPSNHLDLHALECLVVTLRALPSSLVVVTHDLHFLKDLGIEQRLELVRAR